MIVIITRRNELWALKMYLGVMDLSKEKIKRKHMNLELSCQCLHRCWRGFDFGSAFLFILISNGSPFAQDGDTEALNMSLPSKSSCPNG